MALKVVITTSAPRTSPLSIERIATAPRLRSLSKPDCTHENQPGQNLSHHPLPAVQIHLGKSETKYDHARNGSNLHRQPAAFRGRLEDGNATRQGDVKGYHNGKRDQRNDQVFDGS